MIAKSFRLGLKGLAASNLGPVLTRKVASPLSLLTLSSPPTY